MRNWPGAALAGFKIGHKLARKGLQKFADGLSQHLSRISGWNTAKHPIYGELSKKKAIKTKPVSLRTEFGRHTADASCFSSVRSTGA
jgi:hypothetical protein